MREKCLNTNVFLVRILLYLDCRIQSQYRKIRTRKHTFHAVGGGKFYKMLIMGEMSILIDHFDMELHIFEK